MVIATFGPSTGWTGGAFAGGGFCLATGPSWSLSKRRLSQRLRGGLR